MTAVLLLYFLNDKRFVQLGRVAAERGRSSRYDINICSYGPQIFPPTPYSWLLFSVGRDIGTLRRLVRRTLYTIVAAHSVGPTRYSVHHLPFLASFFGHISQCCAWDIHMYLGIFSLIWLKTWPVTGLIGFCTTSLAVHSFRW